MDSFLFLAIILSSRLKFVRIITQTGGGDHVFTSLSVEKYRHMQILQWPYQT